MQNLHTKLSLALLAVLAVASVGLVVLLARTSQMYQQEVQQQLNDGLADHIIQEYELSSSLPPQATISPTMITFPTSPAASSCRTSSRSLQR